MNRNPLQVADSRWLAGFVCTRRYSSAVVAVVLVGGLLAGPTASLAIAQDAGVDPSESSLAEPAGPVAQAGRAEADLALAAREPEAGDPASPAVGSPAEASAVLLDLFLKGGWLMAPIVVMSVVVVAVAVERLLALRSPRVAPRPLLRGLRQLADVGDFEPHTAYRMCKEYPSSAARVVAAMLGKAGRPHAEVEAAADAAAQREADRMYGNVRTLNLAAAVTPLMGLLGTVWGMIAAFFVTAELPATANKSQPLAEGIYVALVTTFAGLAVAIPAAVLAHYFESRVLGVVGKIEALVADLMPRMERLEAGPRVDLRTLEADAAAADTPDNDHVAPDWPDADAARPHATHPGPSPPHGPIATEPTPQPWRG